MVGSFKSPCLMKMVIHSVKEKGRAMVKGKVRAPDPAKVKAKVREKERAGSARVRVAVVDCVAVRRSVPLEVAKRSALRKSRTQSRGRSQRKPSRRPQRWLLRRLRNGWRIL